MRKPELSELLPLFEKYVASAPFKTRNELRAGFAEAIEPSKGATRISHRVRVLRALMLYETNQSDRTPPIQLGEPIPVGGVSTLPAEVVSVLSGDHSLESCESAIRSIDKARQEIGDRQLLSVASALMFQSLVSPSAPPESIRLVALHAARTRAIDQDPRGLHYADWLAQVHPTSWEAFDAVQGTIRITSSWRWFREARQRIKTCESLLPQIVTAEPFSVRHEKAAMRVLIAHQASATVRRQADAEASLSKRAALLAEGEVRANHALQIWSREGLDDIEVHNMNQTVPWSVYLKIRLAEYQIGKHWVSDDRNVGLPFAERLVRECEGLLGDVERALVPLQNVALQKLHLSLAIASNDSERTARVLDDLFAMRWPIRRTTPQVREIIELAPSIDGVGRIDAVIFPIWGLWGTLLTSMLVTMYWLCANTFGPGRGTAIASGTLTWLMSFVILWVGVANMEISSWTLPALALPLALLETVTATLIARWILHRNLELH